MSIYRVNQYLKKTMCTGFIVLLLASFLSCSADKNARRLPMEKYRSKMKAGWLGQMAGVGWGAPTEFRYNAMIIPEEEVPEYEATMINQHYQDDIYVEMTFLKTLEDYGMDVSIRQAGIDFANSKYMLWHANLHGRENLRMGIAPPYSGHPEYNSHADDIDYQIEADYSGLIAPGMPRTVVDLGEKFGRLMNYGDGVYGGQFVGAMYAEAFFESDLHQIIDAGLKCIPAGSQYAEAIRDVISWHSKYPDDWQKTWQLVEDKYNLNHDYRRFSCTGTDPEFNIDAKINGAYIVMGLLYGEGDMDKTIVISMRCGQDSDCNPSNAAGILATSLGMEKLPEKFKSEIDLTSKFSFTTYDFPALLEVCEALTREIVLEEGGKIEAMEDGKECFVIPRQKPSIGKLLQCWSPDEISGDIHFTPDEMDKITIKMRKPEDYVSSWQLAGPYKKEGVGGLELFDVQFAPELDGETGDWKVILPGDQGYEAPYLDFEKFIDEEQCVVYLRTIVCSESDQEVIFELGSDDGVKAWVNEELVHQNNIVRGHNPGDDLLDVKLHEGWNEIVLKVTQGVGGWGASLVITDSEHEVLKGLKFK
jgi:ADP-ribosylglycohydrolase